ncbi:GspH/FimT family pseudopilin [Undibacterium sp. TJN25]|uniref:GspH/FimT family pseudopilin n=1 Tax=Undibacterium sp. TJN25 TaxID=3413056 RepID=UPI003BF35592
MKTVSDKLIYQFFVGSQRPAIGQHALRHVTYCQQRGVTLLEVLIVMVIGGILVALAAPSFTATTQKFRILGEANEMVRDMQFARTEAIKQGLPVTICASVNGTACSSASNAWHKGWIVFVDPNADKTVSAIVRVGKNWSGTDTFTADNSANSITFGREGFTIGLPAGTVTFTLHTSPLNTKATQCVAIIKTGRVEVQSAGIGACA